MMLGDLLAAARKSTGGFQKWLEASNPDVARQVWSAAASEGMTPAGYVRAAMSDFARFAGEEDWATLISSLRDSGDPGTVCLLGMVHWRLTAATCEHHAHSHQHHAEGVRDERSVEGPA
jgi:hypothetical protein